MTRVNPPYIVASLANNSEVTFSQELKGSLILSIIISNYILFNLERILSNFTVRKKLIL